MIRSRRLAGAWFLLAASGCGDDGGSGSSGQVDSSPTASSADGAGTGTTTGGTAGTGDAASSGAGGTSAVSSSASSGAGGGAATDRCLLPETFSSPVLQVFVDGLLVGTSSCFGDAGAFAEIHKHDCATGETSVVVTDLPCENTTVSHLSSRGTLFFRLTYLPPEVEAERRDLVEVDLDGVELHRRVTIDDDAGLRAVEELPDGFDRIWLRRTDADPPVVVLDRGGRDVPIPAEAADAALQSGRISRSGPVALVDTTYPLPNLTEETYVLATPEGTHSFSGASSEQEGRVRFWQGGMARVMEEDLHFGVHATPAQGGCSLEMVLRDMMNDAEVFRSEPLLTDNDYFCLPFGERPQSPMRVTMQPTRVDEDRVFVRIGWGIETSFRLPGVFEGDSGKRHLAVGFSRATGEMLGVLDVETAWNAIFGGDSLFLWFPEGDGMRLVEYDAATLLPR